jgi:hypothetical protein
MAWFAKRFRWQFGLRSLFILLSVVGCGLAWYVNGVENQRLAIAAIEKAGGRVRYSSTRNCFCLHDRLVPEPPTPWYIRVRDSMPKYLVDSVNRIVLNSCLPPPTDLRRISRLQTVTEVSIHGVDLDAESLRLLTNSPDLNSLSIWDCRIEASGLQDLLSHKKLHTLSVSGVRLDDRTMRVIGAMKSLEYLQLDWSEFSEQGFAELAKLPQLFHLDLTGTNVTAKMLAMIEKTVSLDNVVLDNTSVSDADVEYLARLKVDESRLQETRITIRGFLSLQILRCRERIERADSDESRQDALWELEDLIVVDALQRQSATH